MQAPSLTPRQLLALLDEAEAAYQRAKKCLPSDWLNVLRDKRRDVQQSTLPTLQQFHAKAPDSWHPALARHVAKVPGALLAPKVRAPARQNAGWQSGRHVPWQVLGPLCRTVYGVNSCRI